MVQTHFTQGEYDRLREYCHVNRYSMSEFMRDQVLESLADGKEWRKMKDQISVGMESLI